MENKEVIKLLTLEESAEILKIKHTGYLKQLALDNYIGFVWVDNQMLFTYDMIRQFIHANSKYPKYRPKRIEDIYDFLSVAEASQLLKTSKSTVYKLIYDGILTNTFSMCGKVCIPRKSLDEYVINSKNSGMSKPYYENDRGLI